MTGIIDMWRRLHTPPKLCRGYIHEFWTAKQRHYYERSLDRYMKTEDGQYFGKVYRNIAPEIGRYEGVRFIESKRTIDNG